MRNWRLVLPAGLLLLAGAGCSDIGTEPQAPPPVAATVSFVADILPVFTDRCVACHGVGGNAGLDLSAAVAWDNLVGIEATNYAPRQRVVVGNPDQSVLYLKVNGEAAVGDRMPLGGTLDAAKIELIRVWIAQGALDN